MVPHLRQYFDTDFSHAVRLKGRIDHANGETVDCDLLLDFISNGTFLSIYIASDAIDESYIIDMLPKLIGGTTFNFVGAVNLPSLKYFNGDLQVSRQGRIDVKAKFFGASDWISLDSLKYFGRAFIYSETNLDDDAIARLEVAARELGLSAQFRSAAYVKRTTKNNAPIAFISHDSRDKESVARKIASGLQELMCPIWYDEYSLKVGQNLRTSIEAGLKSCQKCVLVLSKNFFSNSGWTKVEFDSIFTREILENKSIVLPVWVDVSKGEVYDYSPSLANKVGLHWSEGSAQECCRKLYQEIAEN